MHLGTFCLILFYILLFWLFPHLYTDIGTIVPLLLGAHNFTQNLGYGFLFINFNLLLLFLKFASLPNDFDEKVPRLELKSSM